MNKRQKAKTLFDNILKDIKEGTLETVPYTGISPVWKKFVKIRHAKTKVRIEYVQCRECKGLVPHANLSGTSNLLKHKCKTLKEENYKILPDEKITNVKQFLMDKIIASSATDFCPIEFFCGSGYLQLAQGLVALGEKYGNIDVEGVHPNVNAINRRIVELKEETRQSLLGTFKQAFERSWCSASIEVCNSNGIVSKPLLAIFSIHYFETDLTALRKKNIFAIGIDPKDEPKTTLMNFIRNFNVFGGDELNLQEMKIVTPNSMLIKTVLMVPYNRQDCILYKINNMLEAVFSKTNDFNDIINNCRNIIRFIKNSGKLHQLEIKVKADCETWKSKIEMLEALTNQYDNVMEILNEDQENNFIISKKKAKEIISFVTPFLETMDDLAATEYPTANKIVLWWALLDGHLQDRESYSFWMIDIMSKAKEVFDLEFHPTMDNKVDCFLDPRYRWLKMFPQTEREAVYAKVRELLGDVTKVRTRDLLTDSNKETAPPPPPPKKSRFSKFESTEMDIDKNDEVSMYLQAADVQTVDFQLEFNLIETFWKLAENKFPRLFHLALSRLHVPASCGNTDENGYVEQKLTLDKLNDLMLIGSSHNTKK